MTGRAFCRLVRLFFLGQRFINPSRLHVSEQKKFKMMRRKLALCPQAIDPFCTLSRPGANFSAPRCGRQRTGRSCVRLSWLRVAISAGSRPIVPHPLLLYRNKRGAIQRGACLVIPGMRNVEGFARFRKALRSCAGFWRFTHYDVRAACGSLHPAGSCVGHFANNFSSTSGRGFNACGSVPPCLVPRCT